MVDKVLTRAPRRAWLAVVAGAVAVLASGCVIDVTAELGEGTDVRAVNARGAMVGYVGNQPTRFDPGGGRVTLAGFTGHHAMIDAINDADEVLGHVSDYSQARDAVYPVVWDREGTLIDLRPLIAHAGRPGVHVSAHDINDGGLVVGASWGYDGDGPWVNEMFVVNARTRTAIPIPAEVAGQSPWPLAVNDAGVIVGHDAEGPVRWTPVGGSYVRERLPRDFDAYNINNAGDMVGTDFDTPMVWKAGAPAPTALASPGLNSRDYGPYESWITDSGVIVMNYLDFNSSRPVAAHLAVRWTSANAEPEVFPLDGWKQFSVTDVNDAGVSIGTAIRDDGLYRSVRWTVDP